MARCCAGIIRLCARSCCCCCVGPKSAVVATGRQCNNNGNSRSGSKEKTKADEVDKPKTAEDETEKEMFEGQEANNEDENKSNDEKSPPPPPPSAAKTSAEATDIDKIIAKTVEDIWEKYDKDKSGYLDKAETKEFVKTTLVDMDETGEFSEADFEACFKEFVKTTLVDMDETGEFSEADFEACFKEFDSDGSGSIEKKEMVTFIKKVAGL